MKDYMMIFRFKANPSYASIPEVDHSSYQKWQNWVGGIAAQTKLVSTQCLGFRKTLISADGSQSSQAVLSDGRIVGGNMIVKAVDMNDAVHLSKGCPVLEMGGTVEIRDILPTK